MLHLECPIWFYALLIALLMWWLLKIYRKVGQGLAAYFHLSDPGWLKAHKWWSLCLIAGMVCIILACVNPQYGYRSEKVKGEKADIYIALDISQSMLCEDLSPSRMDRAIHIGEQLIKQLKAERVGLILFAGEAYMQMPLTHDYRTALVFLRNARPDQAGQQGTAIADAIELAAQRDDDVDQINRLLIILSDGEDHEGEAAEAAADALARGVITFTVGVGTEEGGFIPVQFRGTDNYLRDESGNPVRTKLVDASLRAIAEAGGGSYFSYTDTKTLYQDIVTKVDRLQRRMFEEVLFTARASYYQWFTLLGILCWVAPFIYQGTRRSASEVLNKDMKKNAS